MGIDNIYQSMHLFGLGQKTGIDINGEVSGIAPSRECLPGIGFVVQVLSFLAMFHERGATRRFRCPLLIYFLPLIFQSTQLSYR